MKHKASLANFSDNSQKLKKLRTDTAEAIFDDYWEPSQNSTFHSKIIKKNESNSDIKESNNFSQIQNSESLIKEVDLIDNNEDHLSFHESQNTESYINKYPTITTLLTKFQPKEWILHVNNTNLDINNEDIKEKYKYSKKKSNLTKEDIPFNKIQYTWMSDIYEHNKVKPNLKNNSQNLLTDPNDISPIVINFPHPIQLQNISLPYEVLDPRSVSLGSFIWWDRRVWEYNFVYMAKRLSTSDKKCLKKFKMENLLATKEKHKDLKRTSNQDYKSEDK